MHMPKRYPQEVIEAIWVLLCDGLGPSEIRQALASGEATGRRVNMPRRTLADHIRRLKLERGDPSHAVAPGEELEVARSIRRAALEMISVQIERLRSAARAAAPDPLPAKELEALRKLATIADDIAQREAKLPKSEWAEHGSKGAKTRDTNPASLLARIARENEKADP